MHKKCSSNAINMIYNTIISIHFNVISVLKRSDEFIT